MWKAYALVIAVALVTGFGECKNRKKGGQQGVQKRHFVTSGDTNEFYSNNARAIMKKWMLNNAKLTNQTTATSTANVIDFKSPIQKGTAKHVIEEADDTTGTKRVLPAIVAKVAANPRVQEAVIEKGIEVAGKLIDKQLENINQAQEKASDFLKKEIKIDITPEKGWETEDMFLPAGYHIDSKMVDESRPSKEDNSQPFYGYSAGIGGMLMNGCWGTGYKAGDPCFNALAAGTHCGNMIDGAAFIGVGFDGRGEYSPESRKMSIIQRDCAGKSSYDGFQVPDTMNVHGIYDTTAMTLTFSSRSEYRTYLQTEAGVSGSFFGFYAGVKSAWGSSSSGARQSFLSIFDINVDRYEIFQDEVKPGSLSRSFLREFMDLPLSYFEPGAPLLYQDFILRWGTHYIKSARFGGQLEFRKTMEGEMGMTKTEFAVEMVAEYKGLFASGGARSSTQTGSSAKSERKFMSSSIVAQGGDQQIASVITDTYTPTLKTELKAWLASIPNYPKAFKFHMGSISDLLNFRANDLFTEEPLRWGCEGNRENLVFDAEVKKSYYNSNENGTVVKRYCEYTSRDGLESAIKRRRISLKRAIEIYMEEGPVSVSNIELPAKDGCQTMDPSTQSTSPRPTWDEMTVGNKPFKVIFDMRRDIPGSDSSGYGIEKSASRVVHFSQSKWYTSEEDGTFHLYDGFDNDGTGVTSNHKISIFGLVLTYNPTHGSLILNTADYEKSKIFFPLLSPALKNRQLAKVEWSSKGLFEKSSENSLGYLPCNVKWSNALRFDPSDRGGKCLHFTASSKDTIFVVFSVVPNNKDTWYYVEISPYGVGIYKSQRLRVSTVDTNAVALGDPILYQSYFVCVTESDTSTVIEYGKSQGTMDNGDVYLTLIDRTQKLHVRFYAFGNGEERVQIMDIHIVSRTLTQTGCKGDTHHDAEKGMCVQRCHEACDPLEGCQRKSTGEPLATECNVCRHVKETSGSTTTCRDSCPAGFKPNKNKVCVQSYQVTLKSTTALSDSNIRGMPVLMDLTICFWSRISRLDPRTESEHTIFRYTHLNTDEMFFTVHNKIHSYLLFFSVGGKGTLSTYSLSNDWHMFCMTREGSSGLLNNYVDGTNNVGFSGGIAASPGRNIPAGGVLHLGGMPSPVLQITISDMNIWDRVITPDEIESMALACGDDTGNVMDWANIKTGLNLSKFVVVSPTTCRAREREEAGQPGTSHSKKQFVQHHDAQ